MLKISKVRQTTTHVHYQLDGSLSGAWVAELSRICEEALAQGHSLALDLGNLRFVDDGGAELLKRLSEQQVSQFNCSAYVRAQVQGGI